MSLPTPYLLCCAPLLVPKVWGGTRLRRDWSKVSPDLPPNSPVGESWEVADLPEGQSSILNGPLGGKTLHEAVTLWGERLTGGDYPRFPLLVKFLDAQQDLSVQVHPGHADLPGLAPDARSKDEAWVILESHTGSILHGLSPGVTRPMLDQALTTGDPVPLLRRKHVAPGDVIHVPPGTIHAICAGTVLLEIQEPSDTTYRVFDYNRPGIDGALRPLHLPQALAVSNFGPQPPLLTRPIPLKVPEPEVIAQLLIVDAPYHITRFDMPPGTTHTWHARAHSPSVFIVTHGACAIEGESLERGQTAILPASLPQVTWNAGPQGCQVVAAHLA